MTRAQCPRIPDAPTAHHAGLNRQLRRWLAAELPALRPLIQAGTARCQADYDRRHFDAFAHACLPLFHGLAALPSLCQSYAAFAGCRGLVALSGLAADPAAEGLRLSFSQLAASNTTRPGRRLAGLVAVLSRRVRQAGHRPGSAVPPNWRCWPISG